MSKPMKLKDKIEDQLVDESPAEELNDPYFSLDDLEDDALYLGLDDDDFMGREKVNQVLAGEQAVRFLGLPVRPHNHLKRGDVSRITERFERLLTRLRKSGGDENRLFWDNILIKVWNKKNLAVLNGRDIKGKPTAPCPSADIPASEYDGDIFGGSAMVDFLSEVERAQKWREYFIQLISVNVTEEMSRA